MAERTEQCDVHAQHNGNIPADLRGDICRLQRQRQRNRHRRWYAFTCRNLINTTFRDQCKALGLFKSARAIVDCLRVFYRICLQPGTLPRLGLCHRLTYFFSRRYVGYQ